MKRSLVFCAIALMAVAANSARADIDVQVNLRYNNPADESQGGTYELLVESTTADGVAGIVAAVDNLNNDAVTEANAFWEVFQTQQIGTAVEIVAGSDLTSAPTDVGVAGGTGVVVDDLYTNGTGASPWEHSSLIASGTFGGSRPAFTTIAAINSTTAGNTIDGSAVVSAATIGRMSIRGDGIASDGLLRGDVNRDGDVDGDDLNEVLLRFNTSGHGWDQGDVAGIGDGNVNGDDLNEVLLTFNVAPATPPAVAGVPEPTTLVLGALAVAGFAGMRRRS